MGLLFYPLALLASVILLSFSFRLSQPLSLSNEARQRLNDFHAFATEFIQLLLGLLGLVNVILAVNASFSVTAILATLGFHVSLVYAVDLLESRIIVGRWQHPYRWHCFVLTRAALASRLKKRGKRNVRTRCAGSLVPMKCEQMRVDEKVRQQMLEGLVWLDLTCGSKIGDDNEKKTTRRQEFSDCSIMKELQFREDWTFHGLSSLEHLDLAIRPGNNIKSSLTKPNLVNVTVTTEISGVKPIATTNSTSTELSPFHAHADFERRRSLHERVMKASKESLREQVLRRSLEVKESSDTMSVIGYTYGSWNDH